MRPRRPAASKRFAKRRHARAAHRAFLPHPVRRPRASLEPRARAPRSRHLLQELSRVAVPPARRRARSPQPRSCSSDGVAGSADPMAR
jgi:hypothetical protein